MTRTVATVSEGVLIAADRRAEDLISWWWKHYTQYNQKPVAIVNFGMSDQALSWCRRRMRVIPFPLEHSYIYPKHKISRAHVKQWTKRYRGPLWSAREAWFKKPKACLLTPFEKTLWLDLDCEVCGSLDSLFEELEKKIELAIVQEDDRFSKQLMYNSGVMLFRKEAPFLYKWDLLCREQNQTMLGDQDVLTQMIIENKIPFKELSPFYNWLMNHGAHPGIIIAHWAAAWGKEYIHRFGGLHALLQNLFSHT